MIHVKADRWVTDGARIVLTIKIDDEASLLTFTELVNRALNTWDQAPKDMKDLGDMLTHGRVTQDHTPFAIKRKSTVE